MTFTDNTQQGAPTDNSRVDDGGPAFPNTGNSNWDLRPAAGMTLRDWLAGQALAGLTGNSGISISLGENHPDANETIATVSYVLADAMLAARKGGDQ